MHRARSKESIVSQLKRGVAEITIGFGLLLLALPWAPMALVLLSCTEAMGAGGEDVQKTKMNPTMCIVAGANQTDRLAAEQLQNYIKTATNEQIALADATEASRASLLFLLGTTDSNPAIANLAAAGKVTLGKDPEGFTVGFLSGGVSGLSQDCVVIAGNGHVMLGGGSGRKLAGDWRSMSFEEKAPHPPVAVNSSVLYGVYAFLEETLSFGSLPANDLAPADTHEWMDRVDVQEFRKRIARLEAKPIVQEPTFRIRGSWFIDSYYKWRSILPWMSKNRMNEFTIYPLAFKELNGKLPPGANRPAFTWDELRALVEQAHALGIAVHAQVLSRPYAGINWYMGGFEELLRELTHEDIRPFLQENPDCAAGPTKGRSAVEGAGATVPFECSAHEETRRYFAWLVNRFIDVLEDNGIHVDDVNLGEFDSDDRCLCPRCEGKRDLAEIRLATAVVDSLERRGLGWRPVVWCVRGNPQELPSFFGQEDPYLGSSLPLVPAEKILGWVRPYGNMNEPFYRKAYMGSFKKALPDSLLVVDNQVMAWSDEMAPYRLQPKCEYIWNSQQWIAGELGGAVGMMPDIRVERSEVTVTVYARAMWNPFERKLEDELTRVAGAFYGRNVGEAMGKATQWLEWASAKSLYGYMGGHEKYGFLWFKNPPGNGRYLYNDYVSIEKKPGRNVFYRDFAEAQRASSEAAALAAQAEKEALNDSYREKIAAARLTALYYSYEARMLEVLSTIYDHVYNAKVAVTRNDPATAREWVEKGAVFAQQNQELLNSLRDIVNVDRTMKYPPKFERELYQADFYQTEILGERGYIARVRRLLEENPPSLLTDSDPGSAGAPAAQEKVGSEYVVPGKP